MRYCEPLKPFAVRHHCYVLGGGLRLAFFCLLMCVKLGVYLCALALSPSASLWGDRFRNGPNAKAPNLLFICGVLGPSKKKKTHCVRKEVTAPDGYVERKMKIKFYNMLITPGGTIHIFSPHRGFFGTTFLISFSYFFFGYPYPYKTGQCSKLDRNVLGFVFFLFASVFHFHFVAILA